MPPRVWWGLLREGGFRVHPSRWPMMLAISLATPVNAALGLVQRILFGRRLRDAELHGPPVFIVGHWRSGTTLLHELLVLDERFGSPSTFQSFAPHHFLVSEWFFHRFAAWLLPGRRPMDNMATGWDRPQEDEFALMNMGARSPYRRIAFPENGFGDLEYLDFEGVDQADQQAWLTMLSEFLRGVSYASGRRLVVKSPTHTGRIGLLAKAFPDAKFIHLTRDPLSLFPSTVRLWKSLGEGQSLQKSEQGDLDEYVITCLRRMYAAFERERQDIGKHRLIDVRYEDLVADPLATVAKIYHDLQLADFDPLEAPLREWVEREHGQYQVNRHEIDPELSKKLRAEWSSYFERYGYASPQPARVATT